jgi:regulator of replication initiation timing
MPNTKKIPQKGKAQKIDLKKENLLLKRKIKSLNSIMERSHQLPVEIDKLRQSLAAFFVSEQIRSTAMNEIFQWHQNNKERP